MLPRPPQPTELVVVFTDNERVLRSLVPQLQAEGFERQARSRLPGPRPLRRA